MTAKRHRDMRTIYGPYPVCMPDPRPGTCAIKARYRSWAEAERFCLAIMADGEEPQFAYRHGDHWHTTRRNPYARPKGQQERADEAMTAEHLVTTLADVWAGVQYMNPCPTCGQAVTGERLDRIRRSHLEHVPKYPEHISTESAKGTQTP